MASRAALFDLDGTLTDPFLGITQSIRHALVELGRPAPEPEALRWCIGPPLHEAFGVLLETGDATEIGEAVRLYRERYMRVGKFENRLIDGIPDVLSGLRDEGFGLYVATSKLQSYAGDILEHFGLAHFFAALYGALPEGRSSKAEIVAHILAEEGLDAATTVMIGDRRHDIEGAAANNVCGIGVMWGYGDRSELENAGAVAIAAAPGEIRGLVNRVLMNA